MCWAKRFYKSSHLLLFCAFLPMAIRFSLYPMRYRPINVILGTLQKGCGPIVVTRATLSAVSLPSMPILGAANFSFYKRLLHRRYEISYLRDVLSMLVEKSSPLRSVLFVSISFHLFVRIIFISFALIRTNSATNWLCFPSS